jgi:hypothetical protein
MSAFFLLASLAFAPLFDPKELVLEPSVEYEQVNRERHSTSTQDRVPRPLGEQRYHRQLDCDSEPEGHVDEGPTLWPADDLGICADAAVALHLHRYLMCRGHNSHSVRERITFGDPGSLPPRCRLPLGLEPSS